LEKNPEKINWDNLSDNIGIFDKKLNKKYFFERMNIIREELIMKSMHPKRITKWILEGYDMDDII
jgi:hypothetical protein